MARFFMVWAYESDFHLSFVLQPFDTRLVVYI